MAGWGRCRNCGQPIWWGRSPYAAERAFPYDDDEEQQSHFETCSAVEWITDLDEQRHRVSKCRACGARVWWDTTINGRRRPMDIDTDMFGTQWPGDVCHLETCEGQPARAAEPERKQEGWEATSGARGPSDVAYSIRLWLPDLELTWPCTVADVTRNFRRLALVHHPDMGGNASDFIRIKLAYDRLRVLLGEEVMA